MQILNYLFILIAWTILLNKHKKWNSSGLNTSSKEKVSAFLVLATYFLLLLSIQNIWLILPAITCLLGLICIQLSLYSFFVKRVSLYKIPIIFALHHVYYLSALTGFAFGQLDKYTNKKEYTFEFTNTGEVPLLISDARSTCGCTVPKFTKNYVKPGKSGKINVAFDSHNLIGTQTKPITIIANTYPRETVIHIKGFVNSGEGNHEGHNH